MTASMPKTGAQDTVVFDVERCAWTAPDRLEVAGRWFGVRGWRFVRPTLDLDGPDGRRRLLALLEHKPWAPAEGEPWIAAFAWEGDPADIERAELTVTPNLAVELPAPSIP